MWRQPLHSTQLRDVLWAGMALVPPHEPTLSHVLQQLESATAAWLAGLSVGGGGVRDGRQRANPPPLHLSDAGDLLRQAASSGHVRAARAMVALGASVDFPYPWQPEVPDWLAVHRGQSPLLLLAAGGGHRGFLRWLLAVSPQAYCSHYPLCLAARLDLPALAVLLSELGTPEGVGGAAGGLGAGGQENGGGGGGGAAGAVGVAGLPRAALLAQQALAARCPFYHLMTAVGRRPTVRLSHCHAILVPCRV
jgi:hypothetical protein